MAATIIDGKKIAENLRNNIAAATQSLIKDHDVTPGLAVVLVGEDPASQVYVRNKHVATENAGMISFMHRLPAETSEEDVSALVKKLNDDDTVDGILVQMPLPDHIDANRVINQIDPDKDVDGLTDVNAGRLVLGKQGLVPCTPQGSVILAKTVAPDLTGKHAVVIGRSILVGKPLATLLVDENCTVTLAHSRTKDLAGVCREADIVCAAVGRPELVKADWLRDDAIVIDVGINRVDAPEKGEGKTKLVGDVDTGAAMESVSAITPVPGGVGPMTIACLLRNTLLAASRRRGLPDPKDV